MNASFLAADLKKADPDRYLLSLFAPAKARPALWALFAFHHELVRTKASVSNTQLGLIRLQWWRDEITRVYAGGTGGQIPILSTLAPLIHAQTLPQEWFDTLLYAREFDLEDVAPANFDGLRHYADFTTTPLNQLALKIIGESTEIDEIRAISTNFGVFEAIRSVPLSLGQGKCLLPEDMLATQNLSSQKVMDYNHKAEITQILNMIYPQVLPYRNPKSSFLKLQQRMTFIYLNRFKKHDMNVFLPMMQIAPPFLAFRLALS